MLVQGVRCPQVGRITMDMTLIDVTALRGKVELGDEVLGDAPTHEDRRIRPRFREIGVGHVAPGDEGFVRSDIRFSHEYVTPMAAIFWEDLVGKAERVVDQVEAFFDQHREEWGIDSVYSYYAENEAGTTITLTRRDLDDDVSLGLETGHLEIHPGQHAGGAGRILGIRGSVHRSEL